MARINRAEAAKFLGKVPGEYVFRCNDSCVMGDLKELADALSRMSDETYAFHANAMKNDFSTWITDIIGDKELAGRLKSAAGKAQAARMVADRVAALKKQAS